MTEVSVSVDADSAVVEAVAVYAAADVVVAVSVNATDDHGDYAIAVQ